MTGAAQWTFLFTDIEGSTRLWEQHPEAMPIALARHDALLHAAVTANNGKVFKHTGDGVCAAFSAASSALRAAVDAQRALLSHPWEATGALRARMAIHTGEAQRRAADYFGPALNRTARLMDTAHGGQVVLSLVAAEMARDALPAGAALLDLGEHRLADLARPEHVWQVTHPDLPDGFPALRSLSHHRNNLPVAASNFVGRADELVALGDLVRSSRLVTISGIGGVGKTRLAVQVAAGMLRSAPDGVFLVELAALTDPALVPSQVGRAVGLAEGASDIGPESMVGALCDHLKARRLLLVLDNCEHLVEAVAVLADALVSRCPGVVVLATSREPLGIRGEIVWRAPSLGLPPEGAVVPDSLSGSDSVVLFCERAAAIDHGFTLDEANAAAVARICQRLDGIPLALELAAARVAVLTPDQIADRLDDCFRLLSTGPRTALPRQRTLRATMDWSYDLLSAEERAVLQRVSVFAGGFSLEAAEVVAADGAAVIPEGVLDLLARLVDRSLIGVERQGPAARYRLLEPVRQYADEKLAEAGVAEALRFRHRDYFVGIAHRYLETDPQGPEHPWITTILQVEAANLRQALDWSLGRGDPDDSVAIAATLGFWWTLDARFAEAWARLEPALNLEPRQDSKARARALNALGFLCAQDRGQVERSIELHQQALAMARRVGDRREAGLSGFWLGSQLLHRGQLGPAEESLRQAIDDFEAAGSDGGVGHCHFMLAWIALAGGDRPGARRQFERSLTLCRQAGSRNGAAHPLGALATMLVEDGQSERASAMAAEGVEVARSLGWPVTVLMALTRAAEVALLAGDDPAASRALGEALSLLRDRGGNAWVADCLEMAAVLRSGRGDPAGAARLFGACSAVRQAAGEHAGERPVTGLVERTQRVVQQALGPAGWTLEWGSGGQTGRAEAIAQALAGLAADVPVQNQAPAPARGRWRPSGRHWSLAYRQTFELADSKGLRYLARLLAHPGQEMLALELLAEGAAADRGDAGPVLDERAKAEYRRRITELEQEIEEADAWNDPARSERAQGELDALIGQLTAGVGLGGRDRPSASAAERARVSVRKAIVGAIAKVGEHDADLARLLATTVKTGMYCSYTPDPRFPVEWDV